MIPSTTSFLIVDDLCAMRNVTTSLLQNHGLSNIKTASNGLEALKLLKEKPVDIVLSDLNMPVMDGMELLRALRHSEKMAAIPFIMITAEAEREHINLAIAEGVSDLLVKPYTGLKLMERIEKVLNRKAALPASLFKPPTMASTLDESTLRSQLTLLVVDDTTDNLQLMAGLFKNEYRVKVAQTGQRALEICGSDTPPDLILLDVMMPGMDGFEVAHRLREHPGSETIPVIFVTSLNSSDARLKGMNLGAIDFINKPIDPSLLRIRIKNLMRYACLHKLLQANFDTQLELKQLREQVDPITRHDLKGPLAAIVGLAETALNPAHQTETPVDEHLRLIRFSAQKALDLINISGELSKIERGQFALKAQQLALPDLLKDTVEAIRTVYAAKAVRVTMNGTAENAENPFQVLAEPGLCYPLFSNLIQNACEASPEGGCVHIHWQPDDHYIAVTIHNQGHVPAAIRENFFDKFVTHGKKNGTGLGTYSAKRLVEAQNGTIAMTTSEQEHWTEIKVCLPVAP